jgi:hypothetical protein
METSAWSLQAALSHVQKVYYGQPKTLSIAAYGFGSNEDTITPSQCNWLKNRTFRICPERGPDPLSLQQYCDNETWYREKRMNSPVRWYERIMANMHLTGIATALLGYAWRTRASSRIVDLCVFGGCAVLAAVLVPSDFSNNCVKTLRTEVLKKELCADGVPF